MRPATENDSVFVSGFWFGILVAQSMGFKYGGAAASPVFDQLRAVAAGDLSLMDSGFDDPDIIEAAKPELANVAEKMFGRPLTDEDLRSLDQGRASYDARNRELASAVLREMGQR